MKLFFVANSLTDPTRETFEEITLKSFKKIERLLNHHVNQEPEVRVSAEKDGDEFVVTSEIHTFKDGNHISKTRDRDLRKAVNEAARELKTILRKDKDKKVNKRKGLWKIRNIFGE